MLEKIPVQNILFLDIETVSQQPDFTSLSGDWQKLWEDKVQRQIPEDSTPEAFYKQRAGILAEFGKIICISVAYFSDKRQLRVKSYFGEDEKQLLLDFKSLLDKSYAQPNKFLCAHNGKEFDFPYIGRRMLIHGVSLPYILNIQGKKPWEVTFLDTMELWKFGDWKNFTSLKLLAAVFGIPTPKDDIDGSMVGPVYWETKDLPRIARYCEKDTITLAQLILAFTQQPLLQPSEITFVE